MNLYLGKIEGEQLWIVAENYADAIARGLAHMNVEAGLEGESSLTEHNVDSMQFLAGDSDLVLP